MNVIDQMFLELGIDVSKFNQQQRDALDGLRKLQEQMNKTGVQAESEAAKITEFFTGLKRQAIGWLAGIFGAKEVKEFVEHIIHLDANIGRVSNTLKMSTESLSIWMNIAKQTGGSAEEMAGAMQTVQDQISDWQRGKGPPGFFGALTALHVGLRDANGQIKTMDQLFTDLNEAVQGIDPAIARAHLRDFGIPTSVINTLLMTRQELERLKKENKEFWNTTEGDAKKAQKMQEEFGKAGTAATGFGRRIAQSTFDWAAWLLGYGVTNFARAGADVMGYFPSISGTVRSPGFAGTGTRGDHNNNPGNIEYGPFATSHGAIGSDGRFAIFPSREVGERAMADLLRQNYRGQTLAQIQAKWVGKVDPAYLESMRAATGLSPGAIPDLSNPDMMSRLMRGMTRGEGTNLSTAVPTGTPITARGGSTTTVNIHQINVNAPNARDARGVASGIGGALRDQGFVSAADPGIH